MVITDKVSSADDIARGFLSGGGLAAGLVAISSKSLKPKYCSKSIVGGDSPATTSESVAGKVWGQMTAAEERTRLLEGLHRQGLGTADIESRYLPKGKQGKGSYRGANIPRNVKVVNLEMKDRCKQAHKEEKNCRKKKNKLRQNIKRNKLNLVLLFSCFQVMLPIRVGQTCFIYRFT